MHDILPYLALGDLRSIGKVDKLLSQIQSQSDFDQLLNYMLHGDRVVRLRAADAVEKLTASTPKFLQSIQMKSFNYCILLLIRK